MNPEMPTPDRRADDIAAAELAQELAYTRLLQSISTQLIADQPIEILYESLAAAAATLLRSDFASMQILDPDRNGGELLLIAHRGLTDEAAAYWKWMPRDSASSCGAALRSGAREIVPDIEKCEYMTGTASLAFHLQAGIRSAQSTPLYARDGRLVGMLTTHWCRVHVPLPRELALLDILARQAADLLERRQAEDALRAAHDLLERRVQERTSEVRDLLGRLVNTQEDERRRIARDVHDELGQQMTALRMNIELLEPAASSEQARRTHQLAEELDRNIDFLAWELRPATLDQFGLSDALRTLVREWSARFGIEVDYLDSTLQALLGEPRLDRDIELNIYRIVQEALHNVHRHARATHVGVLIERRQEDLVVTVEDNGIGFDTERSTASSATQIGIIGMRERAALIDGEFRIESSPLEGTTIILRVPLR